MTDLPEDVQATAEKLTHRARSVDDEATAQELRARRDDLLSAYGFTARVRRERATIGGAGGAGRREAADREVLVLHPDDWLEDGTVQMEMVEDLDRAVEIPLTGPGDPEDWEEIAAHNYDIAAHVRGKYGDIHGDNATAFADFMNNHYAKRIEDASERQREEFLTEYFPRNAWPSDDQRAIVEDSITYTTSLAERESDA